MVDTADFDMAVQEDIAAAIEKAVDKQEVSLLTAGGRTALGALPVDTQSVADNYLVSAIG